MKFEVSWEQELGDWGIVAGQVEVEAPDWEAAVSKARKELTVPVVVTTVKPSFPEGTPRYPRYRGSIQVFVEGFREASLDDMYWSQRRTS